LITSAPIHASSVLDLDREALVSMYRSMLLMRGLEERGHTLSLWLHDPEAMSGGATAFREMFGPFAASVHEDMAQFTGADVLVATGWQTVPPALLEGRAAARAYLVQDHEPEFWPTSAERLWTEDGYRHGMHCITAGPWLAELMRERYGLSATPFDLGIDHATYRPRDVPRRRDLVLFYARVATPRRAVPLGLVALEELTRRRPGLEVALFGEPAPVRTRFSARHLGVATGDALARAYSEATAGVVLSMTNHSLVAQEMLACGLAAVELDGPATRAAFGPQPPLSLAPFGAMALADELERLLDDDELRARRAGEGIEWARERTWARAAQQVEAGLRTALARPG